MKLKKYKGLVTDYDFTLTDRNGVVNVKTSEAINNYIQNGGNFAVASGRMTCSIVAVLKRAGVKGLVASYNGAEIVDMLSGKVYFKQFIPNALTVEALEFIEEAGLYVQAYSEKVIVSKATDFTSKYAKESSAEFFETEKSINMFFKENGGETGKLLINDKKEKIDSIYNDLCLCFGKKLTIVRSSDVVVDINAKDVSKASACKVLCGIWGIKPKELIAVGDAGNDEPMIKFAGLGAAPSDAQDKIKQAADIVVPDCGNMPVKFLIDNYLI